MLTRHIHKVDTLTTAEVVCIKQKILKKKLKKCFRLTKSYSKVWHYFFSRVLRYYFPQCLGLEFNDSNTIDSSEFIPT